ncbi:MAG: amidohydrolase [Candidatus Zixiibacteriota bacterium]|nr:MAG: amidohydrolase [candidate division Zixibacteria bacterium]
MQNKKIFINGDFYLVRPGGKRAQAVAVENGIINAIGTNRDISHLWRRGYKKYDLQKKFVLPAFNDAHLHLAAVGNFSKQVDLDGVDSLHSAVSIIKKAAAKLKPGQWLKGRGWNKNLWGGEFPDKNVLDKITDNPVALDSKDWHLLWVNSAALSCCNINRDTPDPPGGVIEKDDTGEPTGILKEQAVKIVYDRMPPLSYNDKIDSITEAQKKLLKLGIAGVGDFDTWPTVISELSELEKSCRLKLRICKMIYDNDFDEAVRSGFRTGKGSEHFRMGHLKLFSDGALGSQTALMFNPYRDSKNNYGVETLTQNQMEEFIAGAVKNGISVAIHAIGDKANFQSLNALGKYSGAFAKAGLIPRIEHAQILRKKDVGLFRKFGITVSVQPIHATSDRDVADKYWGKRARYAYAFRSMLESGANLAFGSDAPIENADPIAGIHAAVARKRANDDRPSWYPEEKIPVTKAIEAYTIGSAGACCFDDIAGSIEIGKRADFAVLSDDIVRMKPSDVYKAETLAAIIDGEFVYGKGNILW